MAWHNGIWCDNGMIRWAARAAANFAKLQWEARLFVNDEKNIIQGGPCPLELELYAATSGLHSRIYDTDNVHNADVLDKMIQFNQVTANIPTSRNCNQKSEQKWTSE